MFSPYAQYSAKPELSGVKNRLRRGKNTWCVCVCMFRSLGLDKLIQSLGYIQPIFLKTNFRHVCFGTIDEVQRFVKSAIEERRVKRTTLANDPKTLLIIHPSSRLASMLVRGISSRNLRSYQRRREGKSRHSQLGTQVAAAATAAAAKKFQAGHLTSPMILEMLLQCLKTSTTIARYVLVRPKAHTQISDTYMTGMRNRSCKN